MSKTSSTVIAVILIVLSILLLLDTVLVISLDVDYYQSSQKQAEQIEAGENSFEGLGRGFAVVFLVLFGGIGGVVSLVSLALSITLTVKSSGWQRGVGIASIAVAGILLVAVCVATPIIVGTGNALVA